MANTIADVVISAKELAFDRFITPTFDVKGISTQYLSVTPTKLSIYSSPATLLEDYLFEDYPTVGRLTKKLLSDGYTITYGGGFIASTPSTELLPVDLDSINSALTIYRLSFSSDESVLEIIRRYFIMLLGYSYDAAYAITDETPLEDINIGYAQPHHMALWVAYWLVDTRRIYELAAESLGLSTTDGASLSETGGMGVNVSLADVFSISENPRERFNEGEKSWSVGADNVLGDASSFWYRLQLWIRSQFERLFSDFALRADNVVVGVFDLQKDQNFYAYYDQYPYTISPLSREILSSFSP